MARRERCHARHPGSHAMTPHQFRPGDTAYALADGPGITANKGYLVLVSGTRVGIPQSIWVRCDNGMSDWRPASRFSHTPPAKETAMTTTPKAGDEMIATLAGPPDDNGGVKLLGYSYVIPLSALRPLPHPALSAAQLAVVEAVRAWCDYLRSQNYILIQLSPLVRAVLDADAALRALSPPPDPMAALQAAQTAFIESLDTREMKGASLERLHVFLRAIAAVVGEKP